MDAYGENLAQTQNVAVEGYHSVEVVRNQGKMVDCVPQCCLSCWRVVAEGEWAGAGAGLAGGKVARAGIGKVGEGGEGGQDCGSEVHDGDD